MGEIIYPKSIKDIKDGDIIQVQYPLTDRWSEEKIYDSKICEEKKVNVKYLIEKKRLRILRW